MTPLCILVVEARDNGRFLLLLDAAVLERDRGLRGFISIDESAESLVNRTD
jgi:hypothetical protein